MTTESKVSQRVFSLMQQSGLTIEELSKRTGLTIDFLENLKNNNVYPSLGPLLKIARTLGVRLGTFMDDQISTAPIITTKNTRKQELSMLRGKDAPVEFSYYSLGKGKSDRHMEPFFIEVFPESAENTKLSSHEGEEFMVVISGAIKIVYGDQISILNAGDSIYYNSIVPHNVSCHGSEKAEIYAVLYFPE